MTVRFLEPEDKRWTDLLSQVEHDLYHLPEYVRVAALHEGGAPVAVEVTNGSSSLLLPLVIRPLAIGGGPLVPGYFDAVSPYGYPHPLMIPAAEPIDETFFRAASHELVAAFRDRQIITAFVRLHPLLPYPVEAAAAIGPIVYHGETVAIDLNLEPGAMLSGMRQNHRRWIKRGLEAGHKVYVTESIDDIGEFIAIYTENMAHVDAAAYYFFASDYFGMLMREMAGQIHLAFLETDGRRVCAMMLSEVCGIVEYHLGGTRSDSRCQSPMVLLTYETARWARERGNRVFHLGGGVGGKADSLFCFKAGFSPLRYPYRTWRVIADPEAYADFVCRWEEREHAPADLPTEFFPSYRKPAGRLSEDREHGSHIENASGTPALEDKPLIIVGAGGHGRETLGLLLERGDSDLVAGFVDDSSLLRDALVDGKPILGGLNWLMAHSKEYRAIVAVGDNLRRYELVSLLGRAGVAFGSVIASSATVSPFATMGTGVMVCSNAVLNTGASVGDHTIINTSATVSHGAQIGSFVHLAPGVHISGDAIIADGALLGTGAVVRPGTSIGEWSVIGSGAVVVSDIGSRKVAYGVPAHTRSEMRENS